VSLEVKNLNSYSKGITLSAKHPLLPIGKKGICRKFSVNNGAGIVVYDYGSTVNDTDTRSFNTCMSYALNRVGYDQMEELQHFEPLAIIKEDTKQFAYTTFKIPSGEISEKLYGTSREGRLVAKSLKRIAHVQIDVDNMKNVFTQVRDIVYSDGWITFDVANIIINHIASNRMMYRLESNLLHHGFDNRLSLYVESNQFKIGYKFYPQTTYGLDELVDGLMLRGTYENKESRYIKKIQESFNSIYEKEDNFPQYIYDKDKRFFYNKYKKGADIKLFY